MPTDWVLYYQIRAGKLWSQIEATYKVMDTAGTELECFQVLQKQEQLAATQRIGNLWDEVQKQKNVEQILQKRYGELLDKQERVQRLMDAYRVQTKVQEEIAAKNSALELAATEVAVSQTVAPDLGTSNLEATTKEENPILDGTTDETRSQWMDAAQEQAELSPKHTMDIDAVDENTTSATVDLIMPDPVEETSLASDTHGEPITNGEGFDSAGSVQFSVSDENPATVKSTETSLDERESLPDVFDENPATAKSTETSLDKSESLPDVVDIPETLSDGAIKGSANDYLTGCEFIAKDTATDAAEENVTGDVVIDQAHEVHERA